MGGRVPHRPRRANVAPPAGAHHFSVLQNTTTRQTSPETGRTYSRTKAKKMVGEALEDGTLPDAWPVELFSTRFVVDSWGPGSYRIDWFSADGTRLSGDALRLDTPPSVARKRAEQAHAVDAEDDDAPAATGAMPRTPFEWMLFMQQRDEVQTERRRQESREEATRVRHEAAAAAERDRQFMAHMMTLMQQRPAAGGEVSGDLLRREMNVAIREGVQQLRGEVTQVLSAIPQGGDDDEDPTTLEGGAERIGLAILKELEGAAPDLVEQAIPAVVAMLQGKQPAAELAARLAALRARTNGAS